MLRLVFAVVVGLGFVNLAVGQAQTETSNFKSGAYTSADRDWNFRNRGNYRCSASDRGWEEHWGGHSSCGECLSKHGECIETCSESYYECTAEGIDSSGRTREVDARGSSRWRTEDEALDRCRDYGYDNCQNKGCSDKDEVVSRRRC